MGGSLCRRGLRFVPRHRHRRAAIRLARKRASRHHAGHGRRFLCYTGLSLVSRRTRSAASDRNRASDSGTSTGVRRRISLAVCRQSRAKITSRRATSIGDSAVAIPEKSIAVLPFENLSSDKENAYFTDGVQDEILTNLAKVADLKVISRTSVMQYRNAAARNLREIGEELGVAHVLEGSVQRAGWKSTRQCAVDRCADRCASVGRKLRSADLAMCLRFKARLRRRSRDNSGQVVA